MRPPSKAYILGQTITVHLWEGAVPVPGQLVHEDGSDHNHGHGPGFMAGHASLQYGELGVSLAQSDDQLADTYLHELFHLFTYYAQVDVAEADVMRLAPIMLDFLRRNPESVEFLTGRRFAE